MRSRTFATSLILMLSLLIAGSAVSLAQDVTFNYEPGTDFTKYHTYAWARVEGAKYPDQILDGQIQTAVDKVLAGKGLKKTTAEEAELLVTYQVAVSQEEQWTGYGGGRGFRYGGMATATSSTINVGTLAVDFYDAPAKQLIWKGSATKTLNPSKDPEKNLKNLDKAVTKLLKSFPPPVKK